MSSGLEGGGRGARMSFLSSHRCPEVDLLPCLDSETRVPPPGSLVAVGKSPEFTCAGESEVNDLDVSSACRTKEEEEEEEEGSISDWSEEDLSLHFSPSVILPSDDEESDPESGFECVDITMETQLNWQEGKGLKMVPKRQIQLKKKSDGQKQNDNKEKLQMIPKVVPAAHREVSASQLVRHRPDVLLRQHSLPISMTNRHIDSFRGYRGLVAGATQGVPGKGSRHWLQKSVSLDDTRSKTKLASCIITSVLTKKMQVEQNTRRPGPPGPPPPTHPQPVRGGAPVVRDVSSLVGNKPSRLIGREESPPPTYQQAMGVKGHNEGTVSVSQSQDGKQSNNFSHSIAQQRRESHPITDRRKGGEALPSSPVSRSARAPPSTYTHPQDQSSILQGGSFQLAPCFYCVPAQVGRDFLVKFTGSAAVPGPLLSGPATPCNLMVNPKSGRCIQVPPPPQRKLLLDPETGRFIQVLLPAASSALHCVNPAPSVIHPSSFAPSVINHPPSVLSVTTLQPAQYAPPCIPFTMYPPH